MEGFVKIRVSLIFPKARSLQINFECVINNYPKKVHWFLDSCWIGGNEAKKYKEYEWIKKWGGEKAKNTKIKLFLKKFMSFLAVKKGGI